MEIPQHQTVTVDQVRIRVEGPIQRVTATRGSPTLAGFRGDTQINPWEAAVERSGLQRVATIDFEFEGVATTAGGPAAGRREAQEAPARVILEAPLSADNQRAEIALLEEDGEYRWLFARRDSREFEWTIEDSRPTERGLGGTVLRKTLQFFAAKAATPLAGAAVRSVTRLVEDRVRPSRVRTFTAADYASSEASVPARTNLRAGPALLLIHGTNSSTHEAFGALERAWVQELNARYQGRVFAFDHPTLATSPEENAAWISDWLLQDPNITDGYSLDILCHSRGGLVARELAERPRDQRIAIRSIVFVATPNNGTPLVDPEHLGEFVNLLTNLAALVPTNPVTDALAVILGLVQDLALDIALPHLPGLAAMDPKGEYLEKLNAQAEVDKTPRRRYCALAADFEPLSTDPRMRRLRNRLFDRVFEVARNDLVVPTRSVYLRHGTFHIPADQRFILDSSYGTDHSGFWQTPQATQRLAEWLRPDWESNPPSPVAANQTDPQAEIESALAQANVPGLTTALAALARLPAQFKSLLDGLYGGPVSPPRPPESRTLGAVIVLPGILGSLLDAGDRRIWISPRELRQGGFGRLKLGPDATVLTAVGLHNTYLPLVSRLAQQWDTFLFPYDWRQDVFTSAKLLADFVEKVVWRDGKRPVHLVAHSLGGLVARAFIAEHADLWDEMEIGRAHV